MVEVLFKKRVLDEPIELKDFIILEKFSPVEEDFEMVKGKIEKKPLKKALSKLLKKGKYNPKYLEETVNINKVRRNIRMDFSNYFIPYQTDFILYSKNRER